MRLAVGVHAHQLGGAATDQLAWLFRQLQEQLGRRRRTVKLEQVEGLQAIVRRIGRRAGDADQALVPCCRKLLAERSDILAGPTAGRLWLANDGGQASADIAYVFGHLTFPGDAINAAAGAAPARAEIEPAVGADFQVGDVERVALEKRFGRGRVGCTVALQLDGHDSPLRPIGAEQHAVVAHREHEVVIGHDAGGRPAPRINRRGE